MKSLCCCAEIRIDYRGFSRCDKCGRTTIGGLSKVR